MYSLLTTFLNFFSIRAPDPSSLLPPATFTQCYDPAFVTHGYAAVRPPSSPLPCLPPLTLTLNQKTYAKNAYVAPLKNSESSCGSKTAELLHSFKNSINNFLQFFVIEKNKRLRITRKATPKKTSCISRKIYNRMKHYPALRKPPAFKPVFIIIIHVISCLFKIASIICQFIIGERMNISIDNRAPIKINMNTRSLVIIPVCLVYYITMIRCESTRRKPIRQPRKKSCKGCTYMIITGSRSLKCVYHDYNYNLATTVTVLTCALPPNSIYSARKVAREPKPAHKTKMTHTKTGICKNFSSCSYPPKLSRYP